jgi:hypothetical protein
MAAFNEDRLSELFRERAQIANALWEAQREDQSLTLQHNELIRKADQAVRNNGKQRARLNADRKGQESKEARARAQRISGQLQHKEVEIADMIAALAAAARPLLSADAIRQLNENLAAISQRLQGIDRSIALVAPTLDALRAAVEEQATASEREAAQRGNGVGAVLAADSAAVALARILRELGQQSHSLQAMSGTLSGQSGWAGAPPAAQVVQLGWESGTLEEPEPRSAQLTAEEISALPEHVTVLLFASEPRDQPRLDLDGEIRDIHHGIEEAKYRDRISLTPWLATETLDLIPKISKYRPRMIQFSGHGTPDGILMMGPPQRSEPLAAERLIQMIKWSAEDLRIVFFNICESVEHARAAAQVVDAAIGMRGDMHDGPARTFAVSLYSGLVFGFSLKKAFHQACAAIGDEPDSVIPQLFFRADSDPHKVVLVRPD